MKWITRERPKIDRLACPWLIKRFIDEKPEIIYVPFDQVLKQSKKLKAIPFDIPDVEFTHYGRECTFDYFMLPVYSNPAPYFKKIAKNPSIKAFVDGITAAVVGALMGSVFVIAFRSLKDIPTLLIALASLLVLIYMKKIKEPVIILFAAISGIILKLVL